MIQHPILTSAAIGYVLGSIPFGYLLVKIFRGADVRTTGSGNIGATNVARTSPSLGLATLILDALKGMAAVVLVFAIFPGVRTLAFVAAFAAICGHVFSFWLGFRGGKGVATGLGSFVLLTPKAVLIAVAIFLAVVALFRRVALASILATASLPVLALAFGETQARNGLTALETAEGSIILKPLPWVIAGALLIIMKHHSNIRRLLAGTEPRFELGRK